MLTCRVKKLVLIRNVKNFPNICMSQSPLNRAQIEQLVRQSLARVAGQQRDAARVQGRAASVQSGAAKAQGDSPSGKDRQGPNPLVVNITPKKWLYQEGQYAAEESVTLIGPRSRMISNLRILGPCRDFDQIELASTDAISLGFQIPVRNSGNIAGTPGCMLMGPAGFLEMKEGVIRAAPHVHMAPEDAAFYGVENKSFMKLRIRGDVGLTFDKIFVRVDPSFKLEVHIDTDEGNACGFTQQTPCELLV